MRGATNADAMVLFEQIEAVIDDSIEGEALLARMRTIRREFALDQNPGQLITDIDRFRHAIESLKYAEVLASQPDDGDEQPENA